MSPGKAASIVAYIESAGVIFIIDALQQGISPIIRIIHRNPVLIFIDFLYRGVIEKKQIKSYIYLPKSLLISLFLVHSFYLSSDVYDCLF